MNVCMNVCMYECMYVYCDGKAYLLSCDSGNCLLCGDLLVSKGLISPVIKCDSVDCLHVNRLVMMSLTIISTPSVLLYVLLQLLLLLLHVLQQQ